MTVYIASSVELPFFEHLPRENTPVFRACRGISFQKISQLTGVRRRISLSMSGFLLLGRTLKLLLFPPAQSHLCITTNPWYLVILLPVARILGRRVTLLILDLFPEALVAANYLAPDSFFATFLKRIYGWCLRHADRVLTLAPAISRYIEGEYGLQSTPVVLGAAVGREQFSSRAPRLHGPIRLVYAGNLGALHEGEALTELFDYAITHRPDFFKFFHLTCIVRGRGASRFTARLHALAKRGLSVEIHERVSDEKWRQTLVEADVCIVTLAPEASMVSFPSKTWSGLAAGCAILFIGGDDAGPAELIRTHECGITVHPHDREGFVAALATLQHETSREAMRRSASRYADLHLNGAALIAQWRTIFYSS